MKTKAKAKAALTSALQSLECITWLQVDCLHHQAQENVFIQQGPQSQLTGALHIKPAYLPSQFPSVAVHLFNTVTPLIVILISHFFLQLIA